MRAHADTRCARGTRSGERGLIYEKFQPFSREISIVGARSRDGRIVYYPLSSQSPRGRDFAPRHCAVRRTPGLERTRAALLASACMHALDYVGVLAIEFFVVEGRLIANEMAPRVHNSGPLDASRAASPANSKTTCGRFAGCRSAARARLGHTAMINFLGQHAEPRASVEDRWPRIPRLWQRAAARTQIRALHDPESRCAKDRDLALEDALKLIRWT